jgi:hypothetical protein
MNTEKLIYVVVGSCGDYTEHSHWNVIATHSEDRAEELRSKLQQLANYNKQYNTIKNEFIHEFRKNNPMVAGPRQPRASEEYIQFNKIKKSTPELKARHRELQAEHNEKLKAWDDECRKIGELNNVIAIKLEAALKEFHASNYNLPSDLEEVKNLDNGGWDNEYSVEELDVLT